MKILLVDEGDSRELVEAGLLEAHANVLTAESGERAIALLQRHRPDVIVSDLDTLGCGGYHLMRMVRSRTPEAGGTTPAIALTKYDRREDHTRAMLAGYQVHLVKPIRFDELLRSITELSTLTRVAPPAVVMA